MGVIGILFIWLIAPFAELAIIVFLAMSNDRYKKRIKELTEQLQGMDRPGQGYLQGRGYGAQMPSRRQDGDHSPHGGCDAKEAGPGQSHPESPVWPSGGEGAMQAPSQPSAPAMPQPSAPGMPQPLEPAMPQPSAPGMSQPLEPTMPQPSAPSMSQPPAEASSPGLSSRLKTNVQSNLGTLALVIGVIFIVIAGVIFATTTWHALPAAAKAFLVLGAAGLFFGASYLAEELLHIHRTGNAFYLLGSIFLFLFCLATAYFKLLGPAFILDGTARWRVLWVGSLVTEIALFKGLERFRDRIYTQTALWGMTVSMCFMAKAFQAGWSQLLSGMMLYASGLVVWKELLENAEAGLGWRPAGQAQIDGGAAFQEAFGAEKTVQEEMGFRELLLDGFRHFVPVHFWVFSAGMALQSLLGIGQHWFLGDLFYWLGLWPKAKAAPITLLNVLAMAALTGSIGCLAFKHADGDKGEQWKLLLGLTAVLSFQYTAFFIPVRETIQFFLAAAALYLWLMSGRKALWPGRGDEASGIEVLSRLKSFGGDAVCTVFLFLNVLSAFLLSVLPSKGTLDLLAASGAIVFLAAGAGLWAKEIRACRVAVPCILWALTITIYMLSGQVSWMGKGPGAWIFGDYERVLFLFLAGMALWDIGRQDLFYPSIAAIGTLAQAVYYVLDERTMPFALLLAASLFIRGKQEKERETVLLSLSSLYLLSGCYFSMCYVTENYFFRMMAVDLGFWLLQTESWLEKRRRAAAFQGEQTEIKLHGPSLFQELCGCGAFLLTMTAFYRGLGERIGTVLWMMGLCVLGFYGYYLWCYRGKRQWSHLLAASSFLPLPYFLADLDWVSTDRLYAGVAVTLLLSGALFRSRFPILKREDGVENGWRADWYHILAVFLLVAMAVDASREWRFWYILLLALYFLQYAAVRPLKKAACFLSACLLAAAIWEQPYIRWPEVLELELRLLPAAMLLFLLRPIFGGSRTVKELQTLGYVSCLGLLCLDAFHTNALVDALLLEGICLAVFILAQIRKDTRWAKISGIIILLVALFMTKSFWSSISWWVYLLAAGIGLIVFAAVNEKKKH